MHTTLAVSQQHTAGAAQNSQEERRPVLSPVWREVAADLDTPVSAYLKLARRRYGYLLESVEGGERLARYSFVGADPYLVLRVREGVAEYRWLAAELERRPVARVPGLPRFAGGAVGYLAYEVASGFEPTVPVPPVDPLGLPEAVFCFTDTLLIFDHVRHRARLLTHAELEVAGGDEERALAEAHARLDAMQRRLAGPTPRM